MAATRSRTENWKNCLTQIADKGGNLEVAVKVDHLLNPGSDLIWRVRAASTPTSGMYATSTIRAR